MRKREKTTGMGERKDVKRDRSGREREIGIGERERETGMGERERERERQGVR